MLLHLRGKHLLDGFVGVVRHALVGDQEVPDLPVAAVLSNGMRSGTESSHSRLCFQVVTREYLPPRTNEAVTSGKLPAKPGNCVPE